MRTMIEKIRGLREDNDLTQRELASVLGTSQTMYARYERGANEIPLRHLVALCKFYNVSADYLLGDEENGPSSSNGERTVTDADIKFALFGGDGEITDEMYEEVKRFAAYLKEKRKD